MRIRVIAVGGIWRETLKMGLGARVLGELGVDSGGGRRREEREDGSGEKMFGLM